MVLTGCQKIDLPQYLVCHDHMIKIAAKASQSVVQGLYVHSIALTIPWGLYDCNVRENNFFARSTRKSLGGGA